MVPRVLHQIWLGGGVPGWLLSEQWRFRELNPGWEVVLWTEESLLPLVGDLEAWRWSGEVRHRADVARLEVLWHEGGVYADADVFWRRGLPDWLCDLEGVWCAEDAGFGKNNCFLVAGRGVEALATLGRLRGAIGGRLSGPVNDPSGICVAHRTGPGLLRAAGGDVRVLPLSVVADGVMGRALAAGVHCYGAGRLRG